jgi:hypothetical protein
MNMFVKRLFPGEDVSVRCFLRNPETGLAEDISGSAVGLTVLLSNNSHEVNVPSTSIFKGTGFLQNEFELRLTSDITSLLKTGMYKAKVDVSYPDTSFPDNTRVVKYVIENVVHVL